MTGLAFVILLALSPLRSFATADAPSESAALRADKHAQLSFPDGKTITVDVVDTPMDRERGLMFRRHLRKNYGMLFVFSQQTNLQFWMKNTLVPLDIVFIGADKSVTRLHRRVKASTPDTPEDQVARVGGDAQFVLELPAGAAERHKLQEKQTLKFDVDIPVL